MKLLKRLRTDHSGVAAIEMAFALPILITMIWMFIQLAQVFRASAGIQQGLGEGARYATLCLSPTAAGCTVPDSDSIKTKINAAVYGIGPGTFDAPTITKGGSGTSQYYDMSVTYRQPTNMLLFPGPTISITRSKRVWFSNN